MTLRMDHDGGSRHAAGLFSLAAAAHRPGDGHALLAPVLVLNASYEPINVCAARRALVLVLKGVAMTEEENGHFLHSARVAMRLPSVIRLLEYRRIPHQSRALSRKNILLRDRNTCQYCATVLSSSELTLDHVVPRSRGGSSTWENLVACCHACNRRKGNQHPAEAGMKLMREPRAFNLHTSRHIMRLVLRDFPALVENLGICAETFVVFVLHDFLDVHVFQFEMQFVVGLGEDREPVLAVNLLPPGRDFGEG